MTGAAQPLAAFFNLFLCQTSLGRDLDGVDTQRPCISGNRFCLLVSPEQRVGPRTSSWSKPLVVHVMVNGASATGPAMAHAAELVSYNRPAAPLLLLPGPAALGPMAS